MRSPSQQTLSLARTLGDIQPFGDRLNSLDYTVKAVYGVLKGNLPPTVRRGELLYLYRSNRFTPNEAEKAIHSLEMERLLIRSDNVAESYVVPETLFARDGGLEECPKSVLQRWPEPSIRESNDDIERITLHTFAARHFASTSEIDVRPNKVWLRHAIVSSHRRPNVEAAVFVTVSQKDEEAHYRISVRGGSDSENKTFAKIVESQLIREIQWGKDRARENREIHTSAREWPIELEPMRRLDHPYAGDSHSDSPCRKCRILLAHTPDQSSLNAVKIDDLKAIEGIGRINECIKFLRKTGRILNAAGKRGGVVKLSQEAVTPT